MPFSRGSSQPRSPALQADSLPSEPLGKPENTGLGSLSLLLENFPPQESSQSLSYIVGRFLPAELPGTMCWDYGNDYQSNDVDTIRCISGRKKNGVT